MSEKLTLMEACERDGYGPARVSDRCGKIAEFPVQFMGGRTNDDSAAEANHRSRMFAEAPAMVDALRDWLEYLEPLDETWGEYRAILAILDRIDGKT